MYNYGDVLTLTARGCDARGVYLPTGEFVVLKGSRVNGLRNTARFEDRHPGSARRRLKLLTRVYEKQPDGTFITNTMFFETAAKAASVLTGDIRGADSWRLVAP